MSQGRILWTKTFLPQLKKKQQEADHAAQKPVPAPPLIDEKATSEKRKEGKIIEKD